MENNKKVVEFYFDFLSPYSYLAWQWAKKKLVNGEVSLKYFPVPLFKVIHHYETKGPAEIPPKRDYLMKHCLRTAQENKIPFFIPHKLPFNSLYALRLATNHAAQKGQFEIVDQLFDHAWNQGTDMEDEEKLQKLIKIASCGKDGAWERSWEKEAKVEMKLNCKKAIERGVFGLPAFYVLEGDELFWGNDCENHLGNFLADGDNLNQQQYQKYLELF
jgi:2-hydroxychromene-2-carboxylate isomerase